jgi:hypothetical protein
VWGATLKVIVGHEKRIEFEEHNTSQAQRPLSLPYVSMGDPYSGRRGNECDREELSTIDFDSRFC